MKNENFKKVNPKQSFPELEQDILKFWQENKTFEKSIENRENSPEFSFYDGPPFATGTPHYGHILAGTIKDVVPRYQTMKGHKVDRKFGWDTHGLPIENIVEKKLEINGTEDIENKIGVHKFNETCRENVFGYANEWRETVERMGRWVDMDNDYKTMDTNFMESVWWVYKSLYDKGLIYEGYRVVPYCPRCHTPLSNFEVNQGYKDKQDKTATVKFKVKDSENKYILAWTTTPWTLMSNIGLAVGKDIDYAEVKEVSTGDTLILAKDRLGTHFKNEEDYTLVREYKGSCLAGTPYEPLFPDFKELSDSGNMPQGMTLGKNAYSVVIGHHVTTESGTGIVHIAPAFGEDDYQIGKEQDLGFVSHINGKGKTEGLLDNNGEFVFDYNEIALAEIKKQEQSFKIDTYNHSYPHCWRCDTPLIYKAISAWYVKVEDIKDKMIANNEKINWTPDIIKHGRFGTWIANAKDWNISRNRYWGSAIPVWQNEDKTEEVCIGSIEDLYQKNKDYGQMTKLIFVRHGRTNYNEKGLMDYEGKANLTENGKAQAREIAKIFENENIDAIYSSPLSRCVDTITPLSESKNIEIKLEEGFTELNSPELQDKEFSCKNYKWENGYGGGETIKEAYARVKEALGKVIEENKGKTVVICSHGDPSFLARMAMHDNIDYDTQKYSCSKYLENNPDKFDISAMYGIEYANVSTKKAMDIHKHFVDEVFVKPTNSHKAQNTLLVHGKTTVVSEKPSWAKRKELIENMGANVVMPQFDSSEDPTYESWAETFSKQDFEKIDTVFTSSLGGAMAVKYILENNIKLERLVMWAPGHSGRGDLNKDELYRYFEENNTDLSKLVKECVVLHSINDEVVDYKAGEDFARKVGAKFIKISGQGHKGTPLIQTISEVVVNGTPLTRVPEVLDCWFESGAMPYASKHFPFEENVILNNDFYVARHGEAVHNAEGIYCGNKETAENYPLTEKGIAQAKEESRKLKEEFDIIISSPILRARQTAEIFQKQLGGELIFDDRLTERDFGNFEGRTYNDLKKWKEETGGSLEVLAPEGMETSRDVMRRVSDLFKEVNEKHSGKKIMLVCHGSSVQNLVRFTSNEFSQQKAKNAEIIKLENNFKFPADFIAEGLDQTRGWFYTLLILGTALFDKTPFMNVIVNGIVLAEDGHKMSKSKKNYPDPNLIFDKYGADAMRFYLMNSPVVEAQDFRFAEAGVEEVVKKVMLPLWNTYSFFTTYANIDDFKPEQDSKILFMRHGETGNNSKGMTSGAENDSPLNQKGIEQATFEAKRFAASGVKIDKVITSCRLRTKQTANILINELGYEVEVEEMPSITEQFYGKLESISHTQIKEEYGVSTYREIRYIYKEQNGVENIEQLDERIGNAFAEIKENNKGKNVLIVGHNGTFRVLNKVLNNLSKEEAHYCDSVPNSKVIEMPSYTKNNALDKWIVSELHKLNKEVTEGFDSYKLNEAARPIVKFMDNLTNWYIRRSRKRFWKSEDSSDKLEAYNTLYEVLVEVSKIIAPFMPFMSDHIFKNLTGKESVHLENFPHFVPGFILEELNEEMDKTQKIINLGLAWRVNNKIRVRQPLSSITIGEHLSDYYKDIIKEELNIKEVIELEDASSIAKKICKPNGRAIGPKFGKDVKFIISEAKAGNFEELESGKVKVGEFILEEGDFELAFEKSDDSMNIEAGFGMAIAMDDKITPELKQEGVARDLVRLIQEARKEADYQVADRINLEISQNLLSEIGSFISYIEAETLSTVKEKLEHIDLEKEALIGDITGFIKLQK